MNIANNGTLPTEPAEQLNANASSSDTKDEEPEVQPSREKSPVVTNQQHQLTRAPNPSTKDEPFSYVGSSSGIYLLSRLFPKDNSSIRPDATEVLPRPLEGHEDDLMIARFNGDRLDKFGFGRKYDPDWNLPPKELTDYLISM